MAESEIESKYHDMLESGDLSEMFPHLSGKWKEDKHEFSMFWRQNEMIFDGDDMDLDIEYDYEDY